MKIEINGEIRDIAATTLATALTQIGLHDARVATALNGTFVPKAARADQPLRDGDRLEILAPMQGG